MIHKIKRQATILLLAFTVSSLLFQTTTMGAVIFTESFGTASTTTAIAAHETANGFDNDEFTFSGSGDIRETTVSTGYSGAGGGANAYLSSSGTPHIMISGISTIEHTAGTVGISFGAYKNTIASTMTTLILEYSTDELIWNAIATPAQATGSGTAIWRALSFADTAIPISSTLSLRWTNSTSDSAFRIDDVVLTAAPEPTTLMLGILGFLSLLRRRR